MSLPIDASSHVEVPLFVAFADLTRYMARCRRTEDAPLAAVIDEFYDRTGMRLEAAGGHVVKFIGDAALVIFPEARIDDGVLALLALKQEVDDWLDELGWDSRLTVKVHFGSVVAGPFGVRGRKTFDVIGRTVNTAAMLDTRTFALSAQAFRKLAPATRRRFKKHTPPVTYIPTAERHQA